MTSLTTTKKNCSSFGKDSREAKQTEKYNPELNYGVYQITKELNTFTEERKERVRRKCMITRS